MSETELSDEKESVPLTCVELEEKSEETVNNKLSVNNEISNIDPSFSNLKNKRLSGSKLCMSLAGGAVGNILEWYDFALFGLLANEIGDHFFPGGNSTVHLLEVYGLFAGSFLVRPLGGLLFGYLGDKYGRIYALRISIILMSIPSFLIGCLPSYNDIGIISTIIVIILRLIQGISAGGELTGALVYVLEICPKNHRSLFGVLVQVSGTGILLASIVMSILRLVFSKSAIKHYAWRIPFLLGIVLLFFGIYIRRYLKDSNEFLYIKKTKKILKNPVLHILKNAKLEIIILVFTRALSDITYYVFFIWIPIYLQSKNLRKNSNYVIHDPYIINTIALILSSLCMIFSGRLGDIYSPRKILTIFGIIFIISMFILIPSIGDTKNKLFVGFEIIIMSMFWGFYVACLEVFSVDIFYNNINFRYSGIGMGYSIATAVFGGLAPLIGTLSVKYLNMFGFSIILCVIGINSVFFMYFKDHLLLRRDAFYQNKLLVKNKKTSKNYEALHSNDDKNDD